MFFMRLMEGHKAKVCVTDRADYLRGPKVILSVREMKKYPPPKVDNRITVDSLVLKPDF